MTETGIVLPWVISDWIELDHHLILFRIQFASHRVNEEGNRRKPGLKIIS
jgi:hypothetical protein